VTVLRTAFDDTMKDTAFVAEANKLGITVDPVIGQDMDEFLAKVYQSPKPLIKRAADILQRGQ
jgi:hypothetical protein